MDLTIANYARQRGATIVFSHSASDQLLLGGMPAGAMAMSFLSEGSITAPAAYDPTHGGVIFLSDDGTGQGAPLGTSTVPEPSAIAALGLAAVGMLLRRNKPHFLASMGAEIHYFHL